VTNGAPPDVVFEGDSLKTIKNFPSGVRENIGGDLRRVQDGKEPLDSGSLTNVLPKVFYLRDKDKDSWYRVPYTKIDGVVYVLDCFEKKTDQIAQKDINTSRLRLTALKARLEARKKQPKKK
jgi:phage-related protein